MTWSGTGLGGRGIPGMPTTSGYDLTTGLGVTQGYAFVHGGRMPPELRPASPAIWMKKGDRLESRSPGMPGSNAVP
jgi:hypothetical protein